MFSSIDVRLRWLLASDVTAALEIEAQAFEFPWSEDDFRRTLRLRNAIGVGAELGADGRLAGYVVYELQRRRYRMLNLAVAAAWRGRGIGAALVGRLQAKLTPIRERIALEVCETNLDAQLFLRAIGFRATGVLRDHYPDFDGDAIAFEYLRGSKISNRGGCR